jgi:hypothetical protein
MASVNKYFGNIIRSSKISISKFKTSGIFNIKDNYIQRLSDLWPNEGVWCAFKSSITTSSNTYMSGANTLHVCSDGSIYATYTTVVTERESYMVKHSPSGTVLWQKKFPSLEKTIDSCIDSSDNCYVMSDFIQSGYYNYVFISKYSSNGTMLWRRYISSSSSAVNSVNCFIGTDGYLYASVKKYSNTTGVCYIINTDGGLISKNNIPYGGVVFQNNSGTFYVSSYWDSTQSVYKFGNSLSGQYTSAIAISGPSGGYIGLYNKPTVDSSGIIYLHGSYCTTTSTTKPLGVTVRLNSSVSWLSTTTFSDPGSTYIGNGCSTNNSVISGNYIYTISSEYTPYSYVHCYNISNFSVVWVMRLSGNSTNFPPDLLEKDNKGNIYLYHGYYAMKLLPDLYFVGSYTLYDKTISIIKKTDLSYAGPSITLAAASYTITTNTDADLYFYNASASSTNSNLTFYNIII